MGTRILVIDDDRAMLKMIRRYLETNGLSPVTADNGSDALLLAREARPDLVLTDAEMGGLDGHSLCRALKKDGELAGVPVMIMSGARTRERDQLSGYEGGAEDYLLKPFSLPLLLAKIKVVLERRAAKPDGGRSLKALGVELDPEGRTAKVNGRPVPLTRKEFDLLELFLGRPGKVLSAPFLLENVWGYDTACYNNPHTVEVHISHLRQKLGPRAASRLVSVTGHGYKLDV